jgi:hypothetical protein
MPSVGFINSYMYTWIIGSFLESNWISEDLFQSPSFSVNGLDFTLGLNETDNEVLIYLERSVSSMQLKIHRLKLDLVGMGTVKILNDSKLTFWENENTIFAGLFLKQELSPNFLRNGELQIRIQIKLNSDDEQEEAPLMKDLCEEMTNSRYFDFVLECDNREISVHRTLLAARSEVFAALFTENFEEGKMGRAIIVDVEFKALEALVKYCQTDQLDKKDATIGLFAAAHKYMIHSLADKCEIYLINDLTVENATDNFLAAYLFNANLLKKLSSEIIIENFDEVEKTEGMKNLLQQYPDAAMEIMKKGFKIPEWLERN